VTEEALRQLRSAVVATLAAGLLWGSSFSVIKIGLRSIDPYWFVVFRFAFAAVVALAYAAATRRLGDVAALLRRPLVIWLGVTNAAGFIFQFKGQTLTTAGNAALLINSCTIFVAIASRFVFRERFGPLKVLAVAAGLAGVVLVTSGGRPSFATGASFHGDLLILVAAFLWTFFILLDKKIVGGRDVDVKALTAAMVVVTAAAALPAAVVFGAGRVPGLTQEWWAIPYTAVFCTVIPFFLWTWGLRVVTATVSSVIMLTEVVFALALAALILGERLAPAGVVGSLLIMAAVVLASREAGEEIAAGPDVMPE
jgi:drug/metabolite transporter (DMT)-like permease